MALGLTQPLTEMSTRNISWGVKVASAYGQQPYHLHMPTVLKSGSLSLLEPSVPVQACNGITLLFTFMAWELYAWHTWMSCVTSSVCRLGTLIIGGFLTLTVHLCKCIWKFSEAVILRPSVKGLASPMISSPGSYAWQLFTVCTAYATCGLFDLVYEICSVYLILFFIFCGPGQHSGYSNLLWASPGCCIYHPPLSSAEVQESVDLYLYSPCRP